MREKVAAGNQHADFSAALVEAAAAVGTHYWIENPQCSFLWMQPSWKKLIEARPVDGAFFVIDFCTCGTAWRKRTRIYTSLSLAGQRLTCFGGHVHQRFTGYCKDRKLSWTKVAEPYTRQLNHLLAIAMMEATQPLHLQRRIDAAAICRGGLLRIGEASKPGPLDLDSVVLVGERTRALQVKLLQGFQGWLVEKLSPGARRSIASCAMAFCCILRCHGQHLYATGEPMYKWRHLLSEEQVHHPPLHAHVLGPSDQVGVFAASCS